MRKLFVGSLVILSFVLLSASAWAVAISSATIDYTANTVTINGFGFGTRPVVYLNAPVPNATYFKNYLLTCTVKTFSKTSQTITANLNAYTTGLTPGTYELIVINPGVGGAKYELTCGAASKINFTNLSTAINSEVTRAKGAEAGLFPLAGGTVTGDTTFSGRLYTNGTLTAKAPLVATNPIYAYGNIYAYNGMTVSGGTLTLAGDPTPGTYQAATATYVDSETNRAKGIEGNLQTQISNLQTSIATKVSGPTAMQAALLQWYPKTITVGSSPFGVAFDGTNAWVTNFSGGTVSVINAATGQLATGLPNNPINVGNDPDGIAFDGTNMWVTNWGNGTVSVINAATGQLATGITTNPIHVGSGPDGIAFDGTNMWVANGSAGTVSVINAATGQLATGITTNPITVGTYPQGIAFDGTNMWVVNNGNNNVSVINAATGLLSSIGTVPTGTGPQGIAFDGTNMWVANWSDGTVSVINAGSGLPTNTINIGGGPAYVAFDGTNMWVTNYGSGGSGNSVNAFNAGTGALTSFSPVTVGNGPEGIAFDGANMWVVNSGDGTVTRIPAR